jgi:CRP/FNR family transcriptional regulator, cyclic AMP receptor protein
MPDPKDPTTPLAKRAQPLGEIVEVLDVLPELHDLLSGDRLEAARRGLRARTMVIRRGRWAGAADASLIGGGLGFLVLDGALMRCVTAAHRTSGELLGTGDLLRPDQDATGTSPFGVFWRAATETRVAILDDRFTRAAAAVPELPGALIANITRRASTVARQLVIAQSQSVEVRILSTLRALSERWGVVTPEGLVLPEFLSHGTLALLLGARRPSVTSAMVRLSARGALRRRDDGRWLLLAAPEPEDNVRPLRPAPPATSAEGDEALPAV